MSAGQSDGITLESSFVSWRASELANCSSLLISLQRMEDSLETEIDQNVKNEQNAINKNNDKKKKITNRWWAAERRREFTIYIRCEACGFV